MKRVYTGYKDFFLYIRKLNNGKYVVDSRDKAFIEYYVGNEPFNTYSEAVKRIDELNKTHKLDRFNAVRLPSNKIGEMN